MQSDPCTVQRARTKNNKNNNVDMTRSFSYAFVGEEQDTMEFNLAILIMNFLEIQRVVCTILDA